MKIIEAVEPDGEFLTTAAFVQRTGVSMRTVFHMIRAGQIRSIRLRRRRLIPVSELVRLSSGASDAYVPYRKAKAKAKAKTSGRR